MSEFNINCVICNQTTHINDAYRTIQYVYTNRKDAAHKYEKMRFILSCSSECFYKEAPKIRKYSELKNYDCNFSNPYMINPQTLQNENENDRALMALYATTFARHLSTVEQIMRCKSDAEYYRTICEYLKNMEEKNRFNNQLYENYLRIRDV